MLSRDEVEEACEEVGRLFQRELLDLAGRLPEKIAGMDDPKAIEALLYKEFLALLKRVAAELAGWA